MSAATTFGRYQVTEAIGPADSDAGELFHGHDPLMGRGVTIRVRGRAPERDFGAERPADDPVLGAVLDWGIHDGVAFAVYPPREGATTAPMPTPAHATRFAATASHPNVKEAGVPPTRRREVSTLALVALIVAGLAVTGFLGLWGFWILGLIALAAVLFVASFVGVGVTAVGITVLTIDTYRAVASWVRRRSSAGS